MATRQQNEARFGQWEDIPSGGRRYWFDVPGKRRGFARYVKIVDAGEHTISFIQEIYGDDGSLIATHLKHPSDTGHQPAQRSQS